MIEIKLNLSYRALKKMKKMYGHNLAREIAIGRKMVKFIKAKYG